MGRPSEGDGDAADDSASATDGTAGDGRGTAGDGTSVDGASDCDVGAIIAASSCALAAACHDTRGTSANFDMATPGWEKALVGGVPKGGGVVPSMCGEQGRVYLVANSRPARGLFMEKLTVNPPPPCGSRMPLLGAPLKANELACFQAWADALTATTH
jgi:hypothetical protein